MQPSSEMLVHPTDGMTSQAAIALRAFLEDLKADGQRLVGYKTALWGADVRARLGATGPVWGLLTDGMKLEDGGQFDLSAVSSAKAEAELVFQLGEDLVGPGVTESDVLAATQMVYAGIEIPAVPLHRSSPETVAEYLELNALAHRYTLGGGVANFRDIDLSLMGALLESNGEVVASGTGARILGSPARSVAWLANGLARHGEELHAGMIVFTGALTEPVSLTRDETVSIDIAHVGHAAFHTISRD